MSRNVKVESDHGWVVNSRFGVKKNVVNERSEISRPSLPKISNRSIPIGRLLGKEYLLISLLSLDHRCGIEGVRRRVPSSSSFVLLPAPLRTPFKISIYLPD